MRRKEAKKKTREQVDDDCCLTCRRYSSSGMRVNGFCMKNRKATRAKDYCGSYEPNYKKDYEMECKLSNWNW